MTDFHDIPGPALRLLHRDGMYLDERRWDDWLDLYAEDCEFWVPTWRTEEELTGNPLRELSHMYFNNRAALNERVLRVKSRRSVASVPMPRTAHFIGNTDIVEEKDGILLLRSSWSCSIHYPVGASTHAFFGRVDHRLGRKDEAFFIQSKKVVVLNDVVPASLDFYCV